MPAHQYSTVFYRLSVEGLEGDAAAVGRRIINGGPVNYRRTTWHLTDQVTVNVPRLGEILACKLARSKQIEIAEVTAGESGDKHLVQHPISTLDFVPIAFLVRAHMFAIATGPRFSAHSIVRVLRACAPNTMGDLIFLPILRGDSLRQRLAGYKQILTLSFNIERTNPEDPEDVSLIPDAMEKSQVARMLVRATADPRGININAGIIGESLRLAEAGYAKLTAGQAINQQGIQEPVSDRTMVPFEMIVNTDGEPEDFAQKAIPIHLQSPDDPLLELGGNSDEPTE